MAVYRIIILLMSLIVSNILLANDQIINIAISSSPNNMSPFYSTDANSQNINRLIHSSLIDFNENMQFVCIACDTFSERMENKKHILRFKLKSDLRFSDNQKVTAQDVLKSYEYFAKNPEIKSTFMGAYEGIEKVVIVNNETVEIVYKSFSLENLSNLSLLKIVKLKNPESKNFEATELVGCGPYVLRSLSPLEIIIDARDTNKPTLTFKVVKDETTLALKLINREIDVSVANVSPRKVNWLKNQKNIKVWERPSGNFQFMGLNHKREIFKDLRVRKAISLLIPREDILKYKLKDTALLSKGMFSPAFKDLFEDIEIEKVNQKQALELLAEAGWVKNSAGLLVNGDVALEIDWKVSNNKASIEIVEVIEHYFKQVGIKVNITVQEWGTYMAAFKGGNFDIVVGQWIGFTGPDMLNFVFHSKNIPPKGANRTSYTNLELDALLDKATVETDAIKRNMLYKEAISLVNKDYAYINLWHPNIIWIARSCMSDINLESTGSFYPLIKLEKKCDNKKI